MLDILGSAFLVLIAGLSAFAIWLFIKVRSGVAQHERIRAIEESMHLPEYELVPNDQQAFAKPEIVERLVQEALDSGARACGNYDVPSAAIRLRAFCLESPPAYLVIYDHEQIEPWTDVVMRLDGGRSVNFSTIPEIGRGAPRHPDDELIAFAPGTATGVLVREAAALANSDTALPAPDEEFKSYFEEQSEKSRQYIQSQAVSQEWLNTIADDAGVELSGDEAEQINMMRVEQQVSKTEADCFKALASSGKFTAAEWDEIRDSLVAVWDEMPGEYVSGLIYTWVEIPEQLETEVDALEKTNGRARERIAQFNAKLPEEKRLVLVGSVSAPVNADIYRGQFPVV